MKARELRELTDDELRQKLSELKEELFNLRFQHAQKAEVKSHMFKLLKKDIARILTILRERELQKSGSEVK